MPINNYWIKVKGYADCSNYFHNSPIFQTSILRYTNANNILPVTPISYENAGPDITGLQVYKNI